MREVGAFQAKNELSALLDRVEHHGERIMITRHGKTIAMLAPAAQAIDREKAKRAMDGILALSKGKSLAGLNIKDLISEGRM